MQHKQNKVADTSTNDQQHRLPSAETSPYATPALYVIGRSRDLLQGSGRHKNDDTGRRGFLVDQR